MADIETIERPSVVIRNLSAQTYGANGFTQYHYCASVLADVLAPGFFDSATFLRRGDHILVSAFDGGAILYVGQTSVKVLALVRDE